MSLDALLCFVFIFLFQHEDCCQQAFCVLPSQLKRESSVKRVDFEEGYINIYLDGVRTREALFPSCLCLHSCAPPLTVLLCAAEEGGVEELQRDPGGGGGRQEPEAGRGEGVRLLPDK